MAIDLDGLEDDLDEMIGDLSVTATFDGHDYVCLMGDLENDKTLENEGFINNFDAMLVMKLSDFDDADPVRSRPKPRKTLTIGGVVYNITRVSTSPDGISINVFVKQLVS